MWHSHRIKYYAAIKRNEVSIHATVWVNLKSVILSERSHTQKAICCIIPFYEMSRRAESIEMENRAMIIRGEEEGGMIVTTIRFLFEW